MGYSMAGRGSIPGKISDISLLHTFHTTSEAYPHSYTTGTVVVSLWAKRLRHEADDSAPFSANVKIGGALLNSSSRCYGIVLN
jgi:hypothetical protein